ncbi:MAG: hypothetical protein RL699_2 [Bacteroidota bacterium]|jgi:hypothetical protein
MIEELKDLSPNWNLGQKFWEGNVFGLPRMHE